MSKGFIVAVFATTAIGAMAPAAAEGPFYGIVGVGRSNIDIDHSAVDSFALRNGLTTSSTGSSSKSTGWKLQLGFPISDTFAVEGGYYSLG